MAPKLEPRPNRALGWYWVCLWVDNTHRMSDLNQKVKNKQEVGKKEEG